MFKAWKHSKLWNSLDDAIPYAYTVRHLITINPDQLFDSCDGTQTRRYAAPPWLARHWHGSGRYAARVRNTSGVFSSRTSRSLPCAAKSLLNESLRGETKPNAGSSNKTMIVFTWMLRKIDREPASRSPCALIRLDFLTNAYNKCIG